MKFGRFSYKQKRYDFGKQCLTNGKSNGNWVSILDETGKLETSGKGWHDELKKLLSVQKDIIIYVRNLYLYDVVSFFGIENFRIFNITDITPEQTVREVIEASNL